MSGLKVLVCGSRDYEDEERLSEVLDHFAAAPWTGIDSIMEGCAAGADRFAERWAKARGVVNLHRPADWSQHGRAAGAIRNRQMAGEHPDLVVAFYRDPLNPSKGTADMVKVAQRKRILTVIA